MDFIEKFRIRLRRWIEHNDHHQEEYEQFARELEEAGHKESAARIREVASLTREGTERLCRALKALGS